MDSVHERRGIEPAPAVQAECVATWSNLRSLWAFWFFIKNDSLIYPEVLKEKILAGDKFIVTCPNVCVFQWRSVKNTSTFSFHNFDRSVSLQVWSPVRNRWVGCSESFSKFKDFSTFNSIRQEMHQHQERAVNSWCVHIRPWIQLNKTFIGTSWNRRKHVFNDLKNIIPRSCLVTTGDIIWVRT